MFFSPFSRYTYKYNCSKIPAQQEQPEIEESKKIEEKKESRDINDSPMFNILGIQLYFDDILIICLIFFLFKEGVDDEWLYVILILLLLS